LQVTREFTFSGDNQMGTYKQSVTVEFTDVDLKIPITRKSAGGRYFSKSESAVLHALKGLSAKIETGRLTAILGPSGSGKTTLLNVLAGRASKDSIPGCALSGQYSINGKMIDPVKERQQFAYVLSEDAMHGLSTPQESLAFAINLKRPDLSPEEKSKKVSSLLEELGISACKDTYVGNELIKGISSGERKRTSVGVDLIHDPLCCFLDEPTTGLDSYTAFNLVQLLKNLAKNGRCVLSTIHQPASETFALFDDVIFIAKGAIVYHGPVSGVTAYFSNLGYPCPENYNPADFVMTLIQTLPEDKMIALVEAWRVQMEMEKKAIFAKRGETESMLALPQVKRAGFGAQCWELLQREGRNLKRDKRLIGMRLGSPTFLSLLLGGILWGKGAGDAAQQSHVAAVTFLGINAMMSAAQPLILTFPYERPVFIREYSGGMYDVVPYFVSKLVYEIPMIFVQVTIICTIGYFMTSLQGNFGIILSGMMLQGWCSAAMATAIGALASNPRQAIELFPAVIMPQFLFGGLWIRIESIPVVLRWIQYIVPLKYAINIMYIGEFANVSGKTKLFDTNNVDDSILWAYYIILIGQIIIFRILGAMALRIGARKTVY
jgi:ABC-type multidrug transport system ATPase subunit/ABC-type multidrug transport system permease subunit